MEPKHWKLLETAGIALLFACVPPTASTVDTVPAPPGDVYDCVLRELAAMEFRVTDTDRPSGFIQAEKEAGGSFVFGSRWTELTVTILPGSTETESELQINVTRTKAQGSGRTTEGVRLTGDAKEHAARLREACSG